MPDGLVDIGRPPAASESGGGGGFEFRSFIRSRQGVFLILAAIAATGLALALVLNFSPLWGLELIAGPFLTSIDSWAWFAAATCLFWAPLVLMLLDLPDNMATGPRIGLPLATLAILIALAVASTFMGDVGGSAPADGFRLPITGPVLFAFLAFFVTALSARVWNAALFAKYAVEQFEARRREAAAADDGKAMMKEVAAHKKEQANAEAVSALIGTFLVIGIGVFAYYAGGWTSETRIGREFGLLTAAFVIGVFAVVLLMDWLADLGPIKALGRGINGAAKFIAFLPNFYNWVDSLLVRIGAHVAGAGHGGVIARYGVLAGTQLCLVVMTWFLPDPWGLLTAFVGLTLAVSVSRLWAWVEEDRNLALLTQFNPQTPRRIGFKEDYKDEAICGFMFVLLLIPMALKQADAGSLFNVSYFVDADHADPVPWFVYFCFELAKAFPVIDWADIYLDRENFETLVPTDPWGQHATFLARALVDLVLVASLLQAISITLRNRQQKALYAARQIDRLDVMVEREELRRAVAQPVEEWFRSGVDFRHYNKDRLRELHANTIDMRRLRFIELIFEQSGEAIGYAFEVLEKLAERRAPAAELRNTFKAVRAEHASGDRALGPMDLEGVFDDLRSVEGLKELKLELLDFAEEIGVGEDIAARADLAQLLELVIFSARRDQQKYTRVHAAKMLTRLVPKLVDVDQVATLLANLKSARSDLFGAAVFVPNALERALVLRLQEIGPPQRE